MSRQWHVCPHCGEHTTHTCRTCTPPIRLTQRGQDALWCARYTLALLISLALMTAADHWIGAWR